MEKAHKEAKEIRDHIDKKIIEGAEGALGKLEGTVARRAHLPNPRWLDYAQDLHELEESRKKKNNNRGDS